MKQILGTVAVGVMWGVAWFAVGALIRLLDPNQSINALWLGPAIGMLPGFVSGVAFAMLVGIATIGRGLGDASLTKVMACGAAAGLLVGVPPFFINQPSGAAPLWQVAFVVIGSMTVLGAILAAGSLALARRVSAARR